MDQSAIKQIQTLGSTPELLQQLSNVGFPVAALPENFNLHALEQFMPTRNQFRGVLKTTNIEEYVKYCLNYEQEGTQCFVDATDMKASSIFDLGTQALPGHCRHKAELILKRTADYQAVLSIDGERNNQKALAEWVEDYAANLMVFSSDGEIIPAETASAAIRNMKFEHKRGAESNVEDFSASQSEYESIAVRTKEEFPMPAVLKFTCEPYNGLPERTFEMRMSTIGNEILILRIKKLDLHIEEMAEQFKSIIINQFEEGGAKHLSTYIGIFNS